MEQDGHKQLAKGTFFRFGKAPQQEADAARVVIVIEDDPNTAELIRINLEHAGLKVLHSADGMSGMQMIRKSQADGVILDIKVPKMNGYEICATMQNDENLKKIPIMIITGLVDDLPGEEESWQKKMGVAAFMCKPFDPTKFTQRVLKMLGESPDSPALGQ